MDDKSGIKTIIFPSLFDGKKIEDPGKVKKSSFIYYWIFSCTGYEERQSEGERETKSFKK